MEKFTYNPDGYIEAQNYLKEIGEWERVSKTGFSTDGWSIIMTANEIWKKLNGN